MADVSKPMDEQSDGSVDESSVLVSTRSSIINADKHAIADEKTPLITKLRLTLDEAYSMEDSSSFEHGVVTDYEPYKLSTMSVFCACKGTVIQDFALFFELFVLTLVFLAVALPLYAMQSRAIGLAHGPDRRALFDKLQDQESNIRKFSLIMTMLAAFLLSLYTSLMVSRWWAIRTGGVGAMKAATSDILISVSQFVTKDAQVLDAIGRYTRASLRLLFIWRRGNINDDDTLHKELVEPGILTNDELDLLMSETWNVNLPESIWAWQVSIIRTLYQEGKIQNDQMLVMLLEKCSEGRAGVQLICTHLSTKVPMQYVHLLGFIVKLHNLIVAVLMGVLFSSALKERNVIVCLQLYGRSILLPFLFNAILVINAELSDPFDGGSADFPMFKYDKSFESDAQCFIEAGSKPPSWLDQRGAKKSRKSKI